MKSKSKMTILLETQFMNPCVVAARNFGSVPPRLGSTVNRDKRVETLLVLVRYLGDVMVWDDADQGYSTIVGWHGTMD